MEHKITENKLDTSKAQVRETIGKVSLGDWHTDAGTLFIEEQPIGINLYDLDKIIFEIKKRIEVLEKKLNNY